MAKRPENVLGLAYRQSRPAFVGVVVASAMVNLLTLSGSLYMLQVYDRVIPSRSSATLVVLTVALVMAYAGFWFFDLVRTRILSRVGARIDRIVRDEAFRLHLRLGLRNADNGGSTPVGDVDQIRSFLASPCPTAIADLPWMPFFLGVVFLFHPWLGWLGLGGMIVLAALAIHADLAARKPVRRAQEAGARRTAFAEACRRNAETVFALGMRPNLSHEWGQLGRHYFAAQDEASGTTAVLSGATKVLRMFLQSAMLGLGAWLVILGEVSAGVMIASSILFARAIAPVEIAIGNWRSFVSARQSHRRLKALFQSELQTTDHLRLPAPRERLVVDAVTIATPAGDRAIVQDVGFKLSAGEGLGVIGPSGSGKTTLIRAIVGSWPVARGEIRLDGAALGQWDPDELGRHIGYLPQDIELFEGTIAQNIGRFHPEARPEDIIAAARAAGVHDLVLKLPDGYGSRIGAGGVALSGGQRQRIALARALYGNPFLLVLDEPNSNLDSAGDAALAEAIASVRKRGGIAVVIAHRPSALAGLETIMVLQDGRISAMGPRDTILRAVIAPSPAPRAEPAANDDSSAREAAE